MKTGIYKITNPITNDFYIGSAINIEKRWQTHRDTLKRKKHKNIHLQRAYDKENISFIFEILELCDKNTLIEREQSYIDNLKPKYNICRQAKSSLGVKRSEETKKKLSIINTGKKQSKETIQKRVEKLKGQKRSDEVKKKFSEAKKGDKNPIFKSGWGKQIEAMRQSNIGKKRDSSIVEKIIKKRSKPVLQYDLNNNFIQEFKSAMEAERKLGIPNGDINAVCSQRKTAKGIRRTAKGFIWKFK